MNQAVILAGGKGSRLAEVSNGLPKSMVKIAGRPVLEHAIRRLKDEGIIRICILLGHGPEVIRDYFKDGAAFGVEIVYRTEDEPGGSAGLLVRSLDLFDEEFLLVFGDTVFNIDIAAFEAFHAKHASDLTLFLHPNSHPYDSDLVECDTTGRVTSLHKKPHPQIEVFPNLVSAALFIVKKDALKEWSSYAGMLDFSHEVIPALIARGERVFGYTSREYIKDMGTPERLKQVEKDVESGKVEKGSLKTKRPAIFLDRDGTLNRDKGYVRAPEELELENGAAEAVRLINNSEYLAVVITNQPVIARGEVSIEGLKKIHNKLEQDLGKGSAYLDAIYYCPHHPDKGFKGEIPEYKIVCNCRKPGTELLERAAKDLNIDLEHSWFVGDMTTDIMTAKNSGIKSILLHTGEAGKDGRFDVKPDFEAENLLAAVKVILFDSHTA